MTKHKISKNNRGNQGNIGNIGNKGNMGTKGNIQDKDGLNKWLLDIPKRRRQCLGRGIHNEVFYIGTYLLIENKPHDAIVTSDRKFYVNRGKDDNEIVKDFNLYYQGNFAFDLLDNWWSNESIKKWLYEKYTVDIRKLFFKIVELNKKYMMYEDSSTHIFVALDIMRSFFFTLFDANGRTFYNADKDSGKTNQLMIYRALGFNPISSADFSTASIYRQIELTGSTILFDDFDDLPEEQKNAVLRFIRVCYKNLPVGRADGEGFRPRRYNSYSHLVFNNVGGIPIEDKITADRLLIIRLLRNPKAKKLTVNPEDPIFTPLRDDLYICTLQYWKQVKENYKDLDVEGFTTREFELFRPFFAIAKVIGEDVYNETLLFANNYVKSERLEDLENNWEFILIKHLWKMSEYKPTFKVSPTELAEDIGGVIFTDFYSITDKIKKIHQLRSFIGSRLQSYVIFKKTRPGNAVFYEVTREGLQKVLASKGWLPLLPLLSEKVGVGDRDMQKKLDNKKEPDEGGED